MKNVVISKNWPVKEHCGICLSEAQNPITPLPLTHSIVYTLNSMVIHTGKGRRGGELNQREVEKGNMGEYRSQNWVENTNMSECTQENGNLQSINSDNHLPQSPCTGQFLRCRHFTLTSTSLTFYATTILLISLRNLEGKVSGLFVHLCENFLIGIPKFLLQFTSNLILTILWFSVSSHYWVRPFFRPHYAGCATLLGLYTIQPLCTM
jgi:hypothetical protein